MPFCADSDTEQQPLLSCRQQRSPVLVGCVSVGEPRGNDGKNQRFRFVIHRFEDRADMLIPSPPVIAHGYGFAMKIQPKAFRSDDAGVRREYISCYAITLDGSVPAIDSVVFRCKEFEKPVAFRPESRVFGYPFFMLRETALRDYLEDDGSLVIDCDIRIKMDRNEGSRVHYPEEFLQQSILEDLYRDAASETADVVFRVGDDATYKAHESVLAIRCRELYEIAKTSEANRPIRIFDAGEGVFKCLLDFVYGVRIPEIRTQTFAVKLLVEADHFGCVPLKLYAESVLVDRYLSAESAAELLILAENKSCWMLKEAAVDVCVSDPDTAKRSPHFDCIRTQYRNLSDHLRTALLASKSSSSRDGKSDV